MCAKNNATSVKNSTVSENVLEVNDFCFLSVFWSVSIIIDVGRIDRCEKMVPWAEAKGLIRRKPHRSMRKRANPVLKKGLNGMSRLAPKRSSVKSLRLT